MNRIGFRALLVFGLFLPCLGAAAASGDSDYGILIARVKFASDTHGANPWNLYPGAEKNLLEEFQRQVHSKVKLDPRCESRNPWTGPDDMFNGVVDLETLEPMRAFPMLLMTSDGVFRLSPKQKENLRAYLEQGGFLLMDDCVADDGPQDSFFRCACMAMEDIFGSGRVETIPRDHEIFRNVFDLTDMGTPFLQGKHHEAQGVFVGDRLAVFINSTDLHCGWVDRNGTRFRPGTPGRGPHTYKDAIHMGINILMYVLSH